MKYALAVNTLDSNDEIQTGIFDAEAQTETEAMIHTLNMLEKYHIRVIGIVLMFPHMEDDPIIKRIATNPNTQPASQSGDAKMKLYKVLYTVIDPKDMEKSTITTVTARDETEAKMKVCQEVKYPQTVIILSEAKLA